ncbi:MAG: hypothetical protein ISP32_06670 [Thermoleophilia bacterium]|nr:hypothetical protein [Thermoleophilia bacterium]
MLFIIGVLNVIQGLVALFKEEVYLVGASGLIITTDYSTWGWMLLIWGIVMVLAALSLFAGGGFGRWFALIVVGINMIGQFAWFPAYPLWSIVAIGLSVAVLWALTVGWSALEE